MVAVFCGLGVAIFNATVGYEKINHYLKAFHYGNEDFSGDPGKNNGLERAWLGSSLKISADQQVRFLTLLISNKLPVSQNAMISTKNNMYLETTPNGWRLYGKTGSVISIQKNNPHANTMVCWLYTKSRSKLCFYC